MTDYHSTPVNSSFPAVSRLHKIGPFTARLIPTMVFRGFEESPGPYYASLLREGADASGSGFVECPRTALDRRRVRVSVLNKSALVIHHPIEFALPGSGLIEQLGLFDSAGQLLFFGPLLSQRQHPVRPETFRFEADSVKIITDCSWFRE